MNFKLQPWVQKNLATLDCPDLVNKFVAQDFYFEVFDGVVDEARQTKAGITPLVLSLKLTHEVFLEALILRPDPAKQVDLSFKKDVTFLIVRDYLIIAQATSRECSFSEIIIRC